MKVQWLKKTVSGVTLMAFLCLNAGPSFSQITQASALPVPGQMVSLSEAFTPPVLKGIKVYPDNPFRFDFILDPGSDPIPDAQKEESAKLVRYFLAALTVPEKDLWVNLSPYEQDRIIANEFGLTEMGREMLRQDYYLKQVTASLIYPDGNVGKKFWSRVYQMAYDKYGTTDIPVDTFNKVWITPDKAVVYENEDKAFIVESHLKVLLESDYLAQERTSPGPGSGAGPSDLASSQGDGEIGKTVLREIAIPELEREVNEGKNFAPLRQVYQSLILAAWFKQKIKESLLSQVYVDRKKIEGVSTDDPEMSRKIWTQYVEAFKKGAYNYIKEEQDAYTGELIPRKYFSGGIDSAQISRVLKVTRDGSRVMSFIRKGAFLALMTIAVALSSPTSLLAQGQRDKAEVGRANEPPLKKVDQSQRSLSGQLQAFIDSFKWKSQIEGGAAIWEDFIGAIREDVKLNKEKLISFLGSDNGVYKFELVPRQEDTGRRILYLSLNEFVKGSFPENVKPRIIGGNYFTSHGHSRHSKGHGSQENKWEGRPATTKGYYEFPVFGFIEVVDAAGEDGRSKGEISQRIADVLVKQRNGLKVNKPLDDSIERFASRLRRMNKGLKAIRTGLNMIEDIRVKGSIGNRERSYVMDQLNMFMDVRDDVFTSDGGLTAVGQQRFDALLGFKEDLIKMTAAADVVVANGVARVEAILEYIRIFMNKGDDQEMRAMAKSIIPDIARMFGLSEKESDKILNDCVFIRTSEEQEDRETVKNDKRLFIMGEGGLRLRSVERSGRRISYKRGKGIDEPRFLSKISPLQILSSSEILRHADLAAVDFLKSSAGKAWRGKQRSVIVILDSIGEKDMDVVLTAELAHAMHYNILAREGFPDNKVMDHVVAEMFDALARRIRHGKDTFSVNNPDIGRSYYRWARGISVEEIIQRLAGQGESEDYLKSLSFSNLLGEDVNSMYRRAFALLQDDKRARDTAGDRSAFFHQVSAYLVEKMIEIAGDPQRAAAVVGLMRGYNFDAWNEDYRVFIREFGAMVKSREKEINGRMSAQYPLMKVENAQISGKTDAASTLKPVNGGIDFNSDRLDLQVQNSGKGIKFNVDPAMISRFEAMPGFSPVIMDIKPLSSLPDFLGIKN